jgi:hypothetical protein
MNFSLEIRSAEDRLAERKLAVKRRFERALKAHLNAAAQEREYDDARAIVGYVNSTRPDWKAEAEAFVAWQDVVWTLVIDMLAAVEAGKEVPPESPEALIESLPKIVWPSK